MPQMVVVLFLHLFFLVFVVAFFFVAFFFTVVPAFFFVFVEVTAAISPVLYRKVYSE